MNLYKICISGLSPPTCGVNIWRPHRDQGPKSNLEAGPVLWDSGTEEQLLVGMYKGLGRAFG